MFKKEKIIEFRAGTEFAEKVFTPPSPAVNNIPKWFKDTKKFANGFNDLEKSINAQFYSGDTSFPVKTFKSCIPLTDSISSGYIIKSTSSIFVKDIGIESYRPEVIGSSPHAVLDFQGTDVLGKYPIPTGYSNQTFRWLTYWKIQTPPGYSSLILHPIHRHDLPFFTLTGVVDTDKMPNFLFLPFFFKEGFTGAIDADTPIAQVIPFKRDDWKSEIKNFDDTMKFSLEKVTRYFEKTYKKLWWSRKNYR